MDKRFAGLLLAFMGAAMWIQAFTYAALNSGILNTGFTGGFLKTFLGYGTAGSLVCSLLCAALGIVLIKTGGSGKCCE
ncbi:hypothetical protein MUJ63_02230 [Lachnospiraceae bacterium NSJ-143]|nr:hypothetical protein [Lachnospiraceae bacterium NSJ-143]